MNWTNLVSVTYHCTFSYSSARGKPHGRLRDVCNPLERRDISATNQWGKLHGLWSLIYDVFCSALQGAHWWGPGTSAGCHTPPYTVLYLPYLHRMPVDHYLCLAVILVVSRMWLLKGSRNQVRLAKLWHLWHLWQKSWYIRPRTLFQTSILWRVIKCISNCIFLNLFLVLQFSNFLSTSLLQHNSS